MNLSDKMSLSFRSVFLWGFCALLLNSSASAQLAPNVAYMFPSGGKAGTTVDVILGGYDWTPDMQVFVLDSRVKLEITGPPGPVIVPEPPYWFGKKARRGPFLLPRETPAKLTIPAGVSPGIIRWQAANANGATKTGQFVVGVVNEIVEVRGRTTPQKIAALPATISGQILKIEEVDRYQFTAKKSGPITCNIVAQAIGSPLNAIIEIRDESGRLVADAADTEGRDISLTFLATSGKNYTASLFDVDFRGNRSFVYRLAITPGPHIVAAIPMVGLPGETRPIEFVGYGLSTNSTKLESVTKAVTFPKQPSDKPFHYSLTTPFGTSNAYPLLIGHRPEIVEPATTDMAARKLNVPTAVTGILEEQYGEDRFSVSGKKGDVWSISVEAARIGSPLDVTLRILDPEEKQLQRIDDLPGTTDASLEFTIPADGDYQLAISDSSGKSGHRAAIYRLIIQAALPGYTLSAPELLNVPIGGKASLTVTAKRQGGFKDPIAVTLKGLPTGITVAKELTIPAGKNALKIELISAAETAAVASLISVTGSAKISDKTVTQTTGKTLVATTIKPPFSVDAEGKDDVTKWPRGTTFPAPVLIERDKGFNGEIVLEMSSAQGRHRQGISGPELVVPPGVKRILYPVFLPEWLETTRTSRMRTNGVAKVADPKGNIRYSVSRLKTRIGFLPGGALLKISVRVKDLQVQSGKPFDIPIIISRSRGLKEPLRLELRLGDKLNGVLAADPLTVDVKTTAALLHVVPVAAGSPNGERRLTIRATVMQNGKLPVISETQILVIFP